MIVGAIGGNAVGFNLVGCCSEQPVDLGADSRIGGGVAPIGAVLVFVGAVAAERNALAAAERRFTTPSALS